LRVELVDVFGRGGGIPRAFIDAHHLPVLAGDAAARKENTAGRRR
jgi:hypothetical protein